MNWEFVFSKASDSRTPFIALSARRDPFVRNGNDSYMESYCSLSRGKKCHNTLPVKLYKKCRHWSSSVFLSYVRGVNTEASV